MYKYCFIYTLQSSMTFNIGINPCNQHSDQNTEHYHYPREFLLTSQNHVCYYPEVLVLWFFSIHLQFYIHYLIGSKITGMLIASHCLLFLVYFQEQFSSAFGLIPHILLNEKQLSFYGYVNN